MAHEPVQEQYAAYLREHYAAVEVASRTRQYRVLRVVLWRGEQGGTVTRFVFLGRRGAVRIASRNALAASIPKRDWLDRLVQAERWSGRRYGASASERPPRRWQESPMIHLSLTGWGDAAARRLCATPVAEGDGQWHAMSCTPAQLARPDICPACLAVWQEPDTEA
jgi:hypothetical protein